MYSTPFSNWPTHRGANETNSIPSRCSSRTTTMCSAGVVG